MTSPGPTWCSHPMMCFTGPASGTEPFGLIVIDKGFWQRSSEDVALPPIVKMASAGLSGVDGDDPVAAERQADLSALRHRLVRRAWKQSGSNILPETLHTGGLTLSDCTEAAALETSLVQVADIYSGHAGPGPPEATATVRRNVILQRMASLWRALALILEGDARAQVVSIAAATPNTDRRAVTLHGRKTLSRYFGRHSDPAPRRHPAAADAGPLPPRDGHNRD